MQQLEPTQRALSRHAPGAALLFAVLVILAVILTARRPPVLDLAQQLDQIRLAGAAWSGERPDLEVKLVASNRLGYIPLVAAWLTAPADWVPRVALILYAVLWLGAVHLIARLVGRLPSTALLASTLLLGSSFYAGFFNFQLGILGLAYWTWALREQERVRSFGRVFVVTLGGMAFFYLAHLLWLLVGGFAVATFVLLHRFRGREAV